MRNPSPFIGVVALAAVTGCTRTEMVDGFPPSFVGVGIELKIKDGEPVVVRTLAGGSAAEAGVQAGDRVTMINGMPTRDKTLGDVVMNIRGKPGSQVTLTLDRKGQRLIVAVLRKKMAKGKHGYNAP
ncbi:MAG: PDZ domain-containing protein [Myxococcota bacterium]